VKDGSSSAHGLSVFKNLELITSSLFVSDVSGAFGSFAKIAGQEAATLPHDLEGRALPALWISAEFNPSYPVKQYLSVLR
jgi:hypothetical protein